MVSDNSQNDRTAKAEARRGHKMLSVQEVEELLRQDADAFRKELEKLNEPQELHRQFEQVMERLEREGLDEPQDEKPDYGDELA